MVGLWVVIDSQVLGAWITGYTEVIDVGSEGASELGFRDPEGHKQSLPAPNPFHY